MTLSWIETLHDKVSARAVVHVQYDVLLLGNLESGTLGSNDVVADVKSGATYWPALLVFRLRVWPVTVIAT